MIYASLTYAAAIHEMEKNLTHAAECEAAARNATVELNRSFWRVRAVKWLESALEHEKFANRQLRYFSK